MALVQSTKRSKTIALAEGATGHKLVTEDVVDLPLRDTPSESSEAPQKYTLTSFCNLETVTDFKLDPQGRSRHQAALVNVTAVLDAGTDSVDQPVKELLVDNVQLLTDEAADELKPILLKFQTLAALAGQISRKRNNPWSPENNPAKAAKTCRALGRSPTGPPLSDYSTP